MRNVQTAMGWADAMPPPINPTLIVSRVPEGAES